MKNSFFTSLCFIIFSATFIILSDCSDHIQSKEIIPLFVFGDSFFDPGNNNYINTTNDFRANFLPYGETFFKYATGRFSDGRLLPDFIAEYAKLPLIPPYLEKGQKKNWVYGVNFASGGGGALVETHAGKAIDLKTQLGYFQNVEKELQSQLGNNEAKHLLSNSVYLFSVGVNDVTAPSSIFSSYSSQDYVSIVIGNYTQVIKELHKKGARKFGFASLFPVGCGPYSKAHNNNKGVNGLQCVEELTSLTKLYNAALSQRLQDLEKQLIGFCYSNFDTFGVAMDMIHNPSKYGFEDVENACCGSGAYGGEFTCGGMRGVKEYELCKDPESHLFFDSYHPSEKGHRLLAELMWHGVPNITWPFNLKSLFGLTSCEGEFIKEHVLLPSVWTNPPREEIEGNSESMIINGLSSVGGKLGIRSKISYAHSLMLLML